jgi:amino acid transporter
MKPASHTGLIRGIRRWDLVAVVINATIGAGIFGLPSRVYSLIGVYSLAAFIVCALVVTLIILCFAEVGSRFKETGGSYLYARAAFGSVVGFQVGWLMWLVRLTAFATNCNLLISYFSYFWPAAGSGLWRIGLISIIITTLTVLNIVGIRETTIATNIFAIGKLIPIALFIVVGLFFINAQNFSPPPQASYSAFSTSVLLLIYAFTGFEMAAIPAGEVQEPRLNLPFAFLIAIGAVALVYTLIQLVCIGNLPELANSEKPLADAGRRFLGAAGAAVISAGALISITGNINANLLAGSRLPFAMAEQQQLPRILSTAHRRFHTPHLSILLTAAIMFALTISSTLIYALTMSTLTRLITYAVTCAALPVLRRRAGAPRALFKAPAGLAVSIAALALAVWLLSNSTWRETRDLGLALAIGLLIHIAYRLVRRKRPTEQTATAVARFAIKETE